MLAATEPGVRVLNTQTFSELAARGLQRRPESPPRLTLEMQPVQDQPMRPQHRCGLGWKATQPRFA